MHSSGPNGSEGGSNGTGGPAAGNNFARAYGTGQRPLTPEQSCIGCLIGVGILVVSLLIWGVVYWLNAEEFRVSSPSPVPPVQEQIRDRTRRPADGASTVRTTTAATDLEERSPR